MSLFFTNVFYWIFMMLVSSIIAMRLLSEERKSGSIETPPDGARLRGDRRRRRSSSGGWCFFLFLWLPTVALPGPPLALREARLRARSLAGYLGIALIGALFISAGTFASSLTKNQIVAAIVALRHHPRRSSSSGSSATSCPSPALPRRPVLPEPPRAHGRLLARHRRHAPHRLRRLDGRLLPLPLDARPRGEQGDAEMDATAKTPSRSTYRATLAISIVLGLGILVLVNYIGSRRYARFDWTTTGLYSLSREDRQRPQGPEDARQGHRLHDGGLAALSGGRTSSSSATRRRRADAHRRDARPDAQPRAGPKAFVKEYGRPEPRRRLPRRRPEEDTSPRTSSPSTTSRAPGWAASRRSRPSRASRSSRPRSSPSRRRRPRRSLFTTGHGEREVRRGPEPRRVLGGRRVAQGATTAPSRSGRASARPPCRKATDLVVVAGPAHGLHRARARRR